MQNILSIGIEREGVVMGLVCIAEQMQCEWKWVRNWNFNCFMENIALVSIFPSILMIRMTRWAHFDGQIRPISLRPSPCPLSTHTHTHTSPADLAPPHEEEDVLHCEGDLWPQVIPLSGTFHCLHRLESVTMVTWILAFIWLTLHPTTFYVALYLKFY